MLLITPLRIFFLDLSHLKFTPNETSWGADSFIAKHSESATPSSAMGAVATDRQTFRFASLFWWLLTQRIPNYFLLTQYALVVFLKPKPNTFCKVMLIWRLIWNWCLKI